MGLHKLPDKENDCIPVNKFQLLSSPCAPRKDVVTLVMHQLVLGANSLSSVATGTEIMDNPIKLVYLASKFILKAWKLIVAKSKKINLSIQNGVLHKEIHIVPQTLSEIGLW